MEGVLCYGGVENVWGLRGTMSAEDWRKLHNGRLHNSSSSPYIECRKNT